MDTLITNAIQHGYSHSKNIQKYRELIDILPEEKILFDMYFDHVGRILDIGCGADRTSFYLATLGNSITGIDITPALIELAQERLEKEPASIVFEVKDANTLEYPPDSFDGVIFSYNGIGHIPRRAGKLHLLKQIHGILKPHGCFFFTAHNSLLY